MRLACLLLVVLTPPAFARGGGHGGGVHVGGYVNSHGTYVAPHYRSAPDSTTSNNWSTQGNVNPYTGQAGTHAGPDSRYRAAPSAESAFRPPLKVNAFGQGGEE